ncbi:hypothetical protein CTheo_6617 [Ceratobasidium theobromae]|uniref:TM7S3/TM198-like domain-containing protein n=1 Tax=Ceratobasidium theobromae TaxID=1582974 RepID=A0A5N5QE95_9AGAM|nr:hypothetical protein CTheo_6617 [Ceratobasidium theobromae]
MNTIWGSFAIVALWFDYDRRAAGYKLDCIVDAPITCRRSIRVADNGSLVVRCLLTTVYCCALGLAPVDYLAFSLHHSYTTGTRSSPYFLRAGLEKLRPGGIFSGANKSRAPFTTFALSIPLVFHELAIVQARPCNIVYLLQCQRQIHVHLWLTFVVFLLSSHSTDASPIIAPRAIIRPVPILGYNVSVFDDTTGALIPQSQASDGGGLINGRSFSAPNIIWAIVASVIGLPLGVSGARLRRITSSLGVGLSLAFGMWASLVNAISENGLASTQSMSDILILLITGAAFLVGAIGGAFQFTTLPATVAMCGLGGGSLATRGVILRPGLLIPRGINQQLVFINIVIVIIGIVCGGLSLFFKQRGSVIFSTASVGSFLLALAVDLLVNGQNGMSRGLRFLFDMNDNHLADLVGRGYDPPLSSQIIVASSLGLVPLLCLLQHFLFPGPFYLSQSSLAAAKTLTPPSPLDPKLMPRPGPTWRSSVLSVFRVPDNNDRPGSAAYNYSQGVYALPSKLLSRQPEGRQQTLPGEYTNTFLTIPNRPQSSIIRGQPTQFAGIGLRSYRSQFVSPGVSRNPPIRTWHAPTPQIETSQIRAPNRQGRLIPRIETAQDPGTPSRPGIPEPQPIPPDPRQLPVVTTTPPNLATQIVSTSAAATAAPTPSPPVQIPRTPHMDIGLGMLRISVDSIINGETNSGYQYGGSRTGNGDMSTPTALQTVPLADDLYL